MEWSKTHVHLTLHICLGMLQAGLYHHYGIPKYKTEKKSAESLPPQDLKPQDPVSPQHG